MTSNQKVRDDQWTKMVSFLRDCPQVYVGHEATCRQFIAGCVWMMRTGAQWRELPKRFGKWNSVYQRFARWSDAGVWEAMHSHFVDDPDMAELILDSTVTRAHPCAAGAPKKRGGQAEQALGRSRGGFSTKIHIGVDGLGNPLRLTLTGGERHDITQAEDLIGAYDFGCVIADKSYDSDDLIALIHAQEAEAVIPPRSNRSEPRDYDKQLYKERHLVECFINKIKHFRRIFSRFDKLATRYLSFVHLASTLVWLR